MLSSAPLSAVWRTAGRTGGTEGNISSRSFGAELRVRAGVRTPRSLAGTGRALGLAALRCCGTALVRARWRGLLRTGSRAAGGGAGRMAGVKVDVLSGEGPRGMGCSTCGVVAVGVGITTGGTARS